MLIEEIKEEKPDLKDGKTFIDNYMQNMDFKFANKAIISEEAFIPGDSEDII
jgi:hypothetical protein